MEGLRGREGRRNEPVKSRAPFSRPFERRPEKIDIRSAALVLVPEVCPYPEERAPKETEEHRRVRSNPKRDKRARERTCMVAELDGVDSVNVPA